MRQEGVPETLQIALAGNPQQMRYNHPINRMVGRYRVNGKLGCECNWREPLMRVGLFISPNAFYRRSSLLRIAMLNSSQTPTIAKMRELVVVPPGDLEI